VGSTTGQSVRASNIKATGRAHTSFYLNQVVAGINYYLIGRHRITKTKYGIRVWVGNYTIWTILIRNKDTKNKTEQ